MQPSQIRTILFAKERHVQIKWRFSVEHYGVSHRCFVIYNALEGAQELARSSVLYGFHH